MPRLINDGRNQAIGMLNAGMSATVVSRHFGCIFERLSQRLRPATPPEFCWSIPGAVKKKIIFAHNCSPPFNKSWTPLSNAVYARPPLMFLELHKILRVLSGQFSTPAKFTPAPPTPIQSLAPLDASSWTLGSANPTQKS